MLLATVLALSAAVLHASWNVAVKQSADRRMAMWGQFTMSGIACAVLLAGWAIVGELPDIAWRWAALSGAMHVPYIALLASAYRRSDFSMSYPVARGLGALSAAFAGMVVLGDRLSPLSTVGVLVVGGGLMALARTGSLRALAPAIAVGLVIGTYSVVDAHGVRQSNAAGYTMAILVSAAVVTTAWVTATTPRQVLPAVRDHWRTMAMTGAASTVAYGLVMAALQHAPVGYVSSLREASVVIAAFAGWRLLDEGDHRRRIAEAAVVFSGLALLVGGR